MTAIALPSGWELVAFDTIGSTNDEAMARAEAGAAEGLVVWAREQQAGKGRRGRQWRSPPGNIYSSTIIRPDCPPAQAAQLSFVVALAVADAASAFLPAAKAITLKWPNDVLVGGAKIAGILLESSAVADEKLTHVVIGTGINLASHPPADATPYATTALAAEGTTATVEQVLEAYLMALAARVRTWRQQGFAAIRAAWLEQAENLGGMVEVKAGGQSLRGIFSRLDESGALILSLPEGGERRIAAGEIFSVAA